jgi:hypothetical protein
VPLVARLSEVMATEPAEIAETNVVRVALHLGNDVFDSAHGCHDGITIDIFVRESGCSALCSSYERLIAAMGDSARVRTALFFFF